MAGKLRITSGTLRGRLIDVPSAADAGLLRPTPDRVRAAIFSSLGEVVKDAIVLDVFAGSGIQALEALSRGAKLVTLVELNSQSALVIKKNAQNLGVSQWVQVIIGDAFKEVSRLPKKAFDLVFADPPYRLDMTSEFWKALAELLKEDAIVIFRREKIEDFEKPDGFEIMRAREYGGTAVFFLRRSS